MKRLYEYLHDIQQEDIKQYIDDMKYDVSMFELLINGIEMLKNIDPIYNDNIIFSLYSKVLVVTPTKDNPFTSKQEKHVFFSPFYFVKDLDISKQYTLDYMTTQQAVGAYVMLDKDYSTNHMILTIIDTIIMLDNEMIDPQKDLHKIITDLQNRFPSAMISAISIQSDENISHNTIQDMQSQILEEQMRINKEFQQKTKDYYQHIFHN